MKHQHKQLAKLKKAMKRAKRKYEQARRAYKDVKRTTPHFLPESSLLKYLEVPPEIGDE